MDATHRILLIVSGRRNYADSKPPFLDETDNLTDGFCFHRYRVIYDNPTIRPEPQVVLKLER